MTQNMEPGCGMSLLRRNTRLFLVLLLLGGLFLVSVSYVPPEAWVMLTGPDANCSHVSRDKCHCKEPISGEKRSHMLPEAAPGVSSQLTCSSTVRVEKLPTIHKYPNKVNLRIIVLTYDRYESLQKTLNSLQDLELDGDSASLEIWMDRSKKGAIDCRTLSLAVQFCWKHGPTNVHIQEKHQGLVGQWVRTWSPPAVVDPTTDELAIVLEDDVDLGKFGYRYLRAAHIHYAARDDVNGYTLTDEFAIYFANKDVGNAYNAVIKQEVTFGYRIVGAWAFAPHPTQWARFQQFYLAKHADKSFHPYAAGAPVHTGWYKGFEKQHKEETMWTMWYIRFTFDNDLFTVYPCFHKQYPKIPTALAYCRKVKGLHQPTTSNQKPKPMMTEWRDHYVKFTPELKRFNFNGTLYKNT